MDVLQAGSKLWPQRTLLRSVVASVIVSWLVFPGGSSLADVRSGGVKTNEIAVYYTITPGADVGKDVRIPQHSRPDPNGPHLQYLMITLLDPDKFRPVEAKNVVAVVGPKPEAGRGPPMMMRGRSFWQSEEKSMEPHVMGGFHMYGAYFSMEPSKAYHVVLKVTLGAKPSGVELEFDVEPSSSSNLSLP